jgi:hypothetical protein
MDGRKAKGCTGGANDNSDAAIMTTAVRASDALH